MSRAKEVLNSNELKQAICNTVLGVSFKDVEKAMKSLLERSKQSISEEKKEAEPEAELETASQATIAAIIPKKFVESKYRNPTMAEVNKLLDAAQVPTVFPEGPKMSKNYPTIPRDVVERLVREYYGYKDIKKD